VRDSTGRVIAAVHAHGPTYRFPGKHDPSVFAKRTVDAADRISSSLLSTGRHRTPESSKKR
jgi:DNA-binding IclR family transcriptional regulator